MFFVRKKSAKQTRVNVIRVYVHAEFSRVELGSRWNFSFGHFERELGNVVSTKGGLSIAELVKTSRTS